MARINILQRFELLLRSQVQSLRVLCTPGLACHERGPPYPFPLVAASPASKSPGDTPSSGERSPEVGFAASCLRSLSTMLHPPLSICM